ncbi:PTS mannose/fructose/sorbose/N-acetylgalactosamine transporter subunit IIC [Faecalitalea cylindroides]|uniref:PTS mannose/fructose/sorbose/N-acetylgalactosamine transporter subunit IIC n=1 Tax=Faecalitalea cylindroides TaxID=39483 RepID=UPI0022E5328C|nr:PTS sugar transporter subunit IIC [Faecalitalea cylindroides]
MSLIQAILIGCVAALTKIEGGWLGEMKFREPIVTGFLVGCILNDVQQGLIIGAQLQLMWMGAVGIGPTAQLDIGTGGTIGVAVALTTGTGAETAIMFGVPIAILMQFCSTILMTLYSGFMARVDTEIDNFNLKAISFYHYLVGVCDFLMYAILTFIVMYFGNSAIEGIINALPDWANSGLTAVSVMLPCVGFALLLNIILDKSLIPYFIIGFIPAAFVGRDLSMIGIVSIAFAIAWIIFELKSTVANNNVVTAVSSDDEWED